MLESVFKQSVHEDIPCGDQLAKLESPHKHLTTLCCPIFLSTNMHLVKYHTKGLDVKFISLTGLSYLGGRGGGGLSALSASPSTDCMFFIYFPLILLLLLSFLLSYIHMLYY